MALLRCLRLWLFCCGCAHAATFLPSSRFGATRILTSSQSASTLPRAPRRALVLAGAMRPHRAVVIGAGVGGLYVAAALARAGVNVTLVEQNDERCAGGRLACETVRGSNGREYRFETGPSLLLLPRVFRAALEALGLSSEELLCLRKVRPAYSVHFADGGPTPLKLGGGATDEAELQAAMEEVERGSYQRMRGYMVGARANLRAGLPIFIREQLGWDELATLPGFLRAATLGGDVNELTLLRDWPLRQHGAQLRDCFASPRHRALMSFQDLYIGLPPDEAPAVFSLLQAIELSEADDDSEDSGVFYPLGGWGTIRDALLHACKSSGVNFSFKTKVSAIRVKNGVCTGVECQTTSADVTWGPNGEPPGAATAIARDRMFLIDADCVVCNADLTAAEALLPAGVRRSAYSERSEISSSSTQNRTDVNVDGRQWRFSSSTITFLFGLDIRYDELTHHNVFLGDDASWKALFDAAAFESWGSRPKDAPFHFYVHAPSRTDSGVVGVDTDDAIMVLVPVPPIDERLQGSALDAAVLRQTRRARSGVISAFEKAGLHEFESHIVCERIRTPPGWRNSYGLRRGAVFGLSHSLNQLSLLRPSRRHPGIRGLHWVGASTRPGNGVPLVLIGAEKVAAEALQDLQSIGLP